MFPVLVLEEIRSLTRLCWIVPVTSSSDQALPPPVDRDLRWRMGTRSRSRVLTWIGGGSPWVVTDGDLLCDILR